MIYLSSMLIIISHFMAGNVLSPWFLKKFPNHRVDVFACLALVIYGCVTVYFLTCFPTLCNHVPEVLQVTTTVGWCVVLIISIAAPLLDVQFSVLRKRVTLVAGHSYLLGGLIKNRDKPEYAVRGSCTTRIGNGWFEHEFKYGFQNINNYDKIIQEFKRSSCGLRGMETELALRFDQQLYAKYDW